MSEPEQKPAAETSGTPAPAASESEQRGPEQRGPAPQKKGPRFPRPRVPSEPVRSLEREMRPDPPRLKEIDDEIAGELEAAMSSFSQDELLAADSSRRVQQHKSDAEGKKQGKVISVHGPDVFVEVPGGRSQGLLLMDQFPEGPPKVGTIVDINIEGYDPANGLLVLSRRGAAVSGGDWNTLAEGMTVEARVTESNKGGLAVEVNGLRGFMPVSQIDIYRVEQPEEFVNQKLLCLVTEINAAERNLVVSRRAYLEREREEKQEKLWQEIAEGQVREGVVRSVRDFGAFVDIGGADGLVHVSEMSWQRVQDPTKFLQPGQTVRVVVLKVDKEARKIGLGLKQLQDSPWTTVRDRHHVGQMLHGTVTRTMDFGAFVEIEPGIEGLVHISELAPRRVFRVTDIVKQGQEVDVKIVSIDEEQRRIGLSIKAIHQEAAAKVEAEKAAEEAEAEASYVPPPPRVRKTPLRGGIGEQHWLALPEEGESKEASGGE